VAKTVSKKLKINLPFKTAMIALAKTKPMRKKASPKS
jgi:hypothetical protein